MNSRYTEETQSYSRYIILKMDELQVYRGDTVLLKVYNIKDGWTPGIQRRHSPTQGI